MIEYLSYDDGVLKHMPQFDKTEFFGCFDIETSIIDIDGEKHGIMYIWQVCIGDFSQRKVIVGRTWKEFKTLCFDIVDKWGFWQKNPLRMYVHNLAYEFQWLRSIFNMTDVFAIKSRIPISCIADRDIKFLCSYKLTNMGLAKFLKAENVAHPKLKYDYAKTRYPDTPLSPEEMDYCISDVLGMHEALSNTMRKQNDTLRTVPLTSTGYVRREARERMLSNEWNRKQFLNSQLDSKMYCLCKAMSRGGDTHANFIYAGQIIDNVKSKDESSSYPAQMVNKKYPFGKYISERKNEIIAGCSNIMHIALYDVCLKKGAYMPYMAIGKCQHFSKAVIDNGRVLQCQYCDMVVNEIDFIIISNQYNWSKMEWIDHYVSDMDYLSQDYRDLVFEMYCKKCELKYSDPYFYNKYKNKINALFGMMLTDITREEILYINNEWLSTFGEVADDLKKYYANKKSFLTYQHGAYVTSWARYELRRGLNAVGRDAVYCDTDSIKYIGEHDADFEALNNSIRKLNESCGIHPVKIGNDVYELGIWEDDANYSEFITYGAKKYAYKYKEPKTDKETGKKLWYGVTVAGLNKEKATKYINEKGLKEFKIGKIFNEDISGRLTPHYNDKIQWVDMMHDGHAIELTSNVALLPTTYTLNITAEYEALLNGSWQN